MGIFKRLKSVAKVQALGWKDGLKAIKKNPTRLLTGIDPASTKLWNGIKGTDDKALVNLYGSPTKDTFRHAEEKDIDTNGAGDFFKIGDGIAGFFGGSAALGGLGNAYNAATAGNAVGGAVSGPGSAGGSAGGGMATGDLINSGLGLVGAGLDYFGNKKAMEAAAKGDATALAELRRQYDINRSDLEPYRQVGTGALGKLGALYGIGADGQPTNTPIDYSQFINSPDYKFALDQGISGAQNSAAARGGLFSGNTLKGLTDYSSGLATQQFGNYTNRLAAIAGIGQTATNAGVQAGQNSANSIGNVYQNQGDSRASGVMGKYGAIGAGLGAIGGGLANYYNGR